MIIYQSYLLTNLVLLIVHVHSSIGVDEVYIGYLWTQKIVLGLEDMSLASASSSKVGYVLV